MITMAPRVRVAALDGARASVLNTATPNFVCGALPLALSSSDLERFFRSSTALLSSTFKKYANQPCALRKLALLLPKLGGIHEHLEGVEV